MDKRVIEVSTIKSSSPNVRGGVSRPQFISYL